MTSIAYESYYNQNLSLVSVAVSNAAFVQILNKTFSPQYVQDYVVFGGYTGNDATGGDTSAIDFLLSNISNVSLGLHRHLPSNAAPGNGSWYAHIPNIPLGAYTMQTRHSDQLGGAGDWVSTSGNALLAIGGLNIIAHSSFISAVSTSSTLESDLVSLTFTPEAGDYLIIGSAELWGAAAGGSGSIRCYVDGSEKMAGLRSLAGTSPQYNGLSIFKKETFSETSHTVKFTGASDGATNITIRNQFLSVVKI